ncbi:MAG: hypothetical protein ACLGIF_07695 [Actinomycetes bacterium]
MRQVFAHDAVVTMDPHSDAAAPGAAVTVALCGAWEHEPPCPLAPHHTGSHRLGDQVRLRILFAAEPDQAEEVRERIDEALAVGAITRPTGGVTAWQLRESRASAPRFEEEEHGRRLLAS